VSGGILLSQMDEPPGREREFHDWYDSEHIPDRLVIPGFAAATRYEVVEGGPRWLVVYELADMAALEHPEYLRLKNRPSAVTADMLRSVRGFTRYTCDLEASAGEPGELGHLVVEAFVADDPEKFGARDDERAAALVGEPGRSRVRRFRVRAGVPGPWTHLVLHDVADDAGAAPGEAESAWRYRFRSRQEASGRVG
jgi:hypothetical protein